MAADVAVTGAMAEMSAVLAELRRGQEALERAEAGQRAAESAMLQLDAIIRHLPVALIVVEAPSGRMLTYNPAAERFFAFPPPLAEGVDEYSELYTGFHRDGRCYEAHEWPIARAVRQGEIVIGEEIELVRPDGVRVVARVSASPVRDAEGRIVAGVVGLDDITAEKRREQRQSFLGEVSDVLSASLDYQDTAGHVAELCARVLADCCVVHVVEEGWVRGLGTAASDPERAEALRNLLRGVRVEASGDQPVAQVLRSGEPWFEPQLTDDHLRRLAPDRGKAEELRAMGLGSLMIVPMNAGGRTLGCLTLARRREIRPFDAEDLDLARELALRAAHAVDNARLYRESQRAVRAQEETINIVSHDLRNALNAALTNADLLLDITPAFVDGSRERRQMESLRRSLDHMHRLVQDLLELDRIERRSLSIHPERFAPQRLIEELTAMMGPLARDSGLHWEVDIPPHVAAIEADHARLIQVLANLVGNAVKATPPGGLVSIRAENGRREVRLHVSDTGAGIAESDLARVFDRFFQVPERGPGGSGLGLSIARGIVEAHGGRMWASSRVGQGSTFSFSMPRFRVRRR